MFCPICHSHDSVIDNYCHLCSQDLETLPEEELMIGLDLSNEDSFIKIDPNNPPKPITIPNPYFDHENFKPRTIILMYNDPE